VSLVEYLYVSHVLIKNLEEIFVSSHICPRPLLSAGLSLPHITTEVTGRRFVGDPVE